MTELPDFEEMKRLQRKHAEEACKTFFEDKPEFVELIFNFLKQKIFEIHPAITLSHSDNWIQLKFRNKSFLDIGVQRTGLRLLMRGPIDRYNDSTNTLGLYKWSLPVQMLLDSENNIEKALSFIKISFGITEML